MVVLCGCILLGASCSKRERTDPNAEEWNDIQALADDAAVPPGVSEPESGISPQVGESVPEDEFDGFVQRLEQMKTVERQAGETLLTGKTLIFDYDQRFVRMDEQVRVVDDHGVLETQSLIGRFSISNEVESIEAKGGVSITSDAREARSETAVYDYLSGIVELQGLATVSEGGNRLSGERIRFWIKGDRKMICEPNALLEISGVSGVAAENLPAGDIDTEIRAERVVYDESKRLVQLDGQVRLRDPRMAMNCDEARIFLKDDNKIDWIEALFGIIIQSGDRKALAERATYHADEAKFTLEDRPKVMQGLNVITADRIIFWHETRRMVCEPNARALLYMDEETKVKFLKDLND
jgi:lipopolysaccharide export system protein LptA